MKISIISIIVNLFLSLIKLAAGILGHSQALVADAIHSASDVLSTFIVIASLLISGKEADFNHEYGHQKFESLASFVLSLLLGYTGIAMGVNGMKSIWTGSYKTMPMASLVTIAAAALSIVVKEAMYQATMKVAIKEKSNALKADAWHHRSDALSSVGSLAGVIFARLGFPVMDAVACLIICVFVIKSALEIGIDAARSLTDCSCGRELESQLKEQVSQVAGVARIDMIKTRVFGTGYYVDLEISVEGDKTLTEAHKVAEAAHDKIENSFSDVLHCMVHVNPM